MKSTLFSLALSISLIGCLNSSANGDLVTVDFSGTFISSGMLFESGDTYFGSYTYDTSANVVDHPDSTLDSQAAAIDSTGTWGTVFAGTGWNLSVQSSVVNDFEVLGNLGSIAWGNDTDIFGDRYIATLTGVTEDLPLGLQLNFFQIDMQDNTGAGEDMLSQSSISEVPNFDLTDHAGGRFFIANPPDGCSQCQHRLDSFSSVPEPGGFALLLGLGLLVTSRRNKK